MGMVKFVHDFDKLMVLRETLTRYLASEKAEPSAYYDAELEYCEDMVKQQIMGMLEIEE